MAAGATARPRSIVLTGASRGIGRATAEILAQEGFDLLLVARDPDRLERAAAELRGIGPAISTLALDLADPGATRKVHEAAAQTLGVPWAVINNAGLALARRFDRLADDELDRILSVNLGAAIRLTHAFLPEFLARGDGRFVHVGSGATDFPPPRHAVYSTTKAALRAFSVALDLEVRRRGVRSTVVEPIFVRTDLGREPADREAPLEGMARRHRSMVLEPVDVGRAIARALRNPRPRVSVPMSWGVARWLGLAAGPLVRHSLVVEPPTPGQPEGGAWDLR